MESLFPHYVSERINYVLDSLTLIDWLRKYGHQDNDIFLKYLTLNNNQIVEIPKEIVHCINLQILQLCGNT